MTMLMLFQEVCHVHFLYSTKTSVSLPDEKVDLSLDLTLLDVSMLQIFRHEHEKVVPC